ncbi:MAG: hypothetical protein QM711_12495 [Micropruina sp.]
MTPRSGPGPLNFRAVDDHSPVVGSMSPAAILIAVDLPQPEGPTSGYEFTVLDIEIEIGQAR